MENLKIIGLDCNAVVYDDYDLDLESEADILLQGDNYETSLFGKDKAKVYYSLSYCQGDGVCFDKLSLDKNDVARLTGLDVSKYTGISCYITQRGHYYHENSMDYGLTLYGLDADENEQEMEDENDKIYDAIKEAIQHICQKLEAMGYSRIEAQDRQNILQQGYNKRLVENNIESDLMLWDYIYTDMEPTENIDEYIHICDSGNTSIKGLWIKAKKDFVKHTRVTTTEYYTFA